MKKCPTNIICLYLIDTLIRDADGLRVLKYGFTKDLKQRFRTHMRKYGDGIALDLFVFVPELERPKAEATFQQSISRYGFASGDDQELIDVCEEAYLNIKTIVRTISERTHGQYGGADRALRAADGGATSHVRASPARKDMVIMAAQHETSLCRVGTR
ncbi:hypothetical protein PR003_g33027 [Phytophthora rubi]|uniref:Uncharacterized protein n=1 Tax=Phytophthora rubi TaxID=129364 RepID=A0A6A3H7M7_9STRA|nr:hypothetical protein PR002_g28620 [Phytophthora rubi]KAE9263794.1 hypothetical protein PR003_g33027 [Phytophthora rubi]